MELYIELVLSLCSQMFEIWFQMWKVLNKSEAEQHNLTPLNIKQETNNLFNVFLSHQLGFLNKTRTRFP